MDRKKELENLKVNIATYLRDQWHPTNEEFVMYCIERLVERVNDTQLKLPIDYHQFLVIYDYAKLLLQSLNDFLDEHRFVMGMSMLAPTEEEPEPGKMLYKGYQIIREGTEHPFKYEVYETSIDEVDGEKIAVLGGWLGGSNSYEAAKELIDKGL